MNRTPSTDTGGARVMNIERVMKYAGGTAALLYNGSLLVVASGPLLILVDIDGQAVERCHDERPGLWRAFSPLPSSVISGSNVLKSFYNHNCNNASEGLSCAEGGNSQNLNNLPSAMIEPHESDGLRQACIRGHSTNIGILKVSPDKHWLLSCETDAGGATNSTPCRRPLLILWDLDVGRRATSLQPHGVSIQCAEFNGDVSLLATVGTDICMGSTRTTQTSLFIWDFQSVLLGGSPKPIARQISDFNTLAITFLNCFDKSKQVSLVTCGRENIRFWRVCKGHLPGRPVLLTEFCRGFEFNALGVVYESARSRTDSSAKNTFIFVASTKGQLLKVDYGKEQVVSAYRLHDCAIRSLAVYPGVVVTGGSDCLLRVWPPDFTDYLLEARHESPVTFLSLSENGMKVTVGTASGTLGVLDLTVHNYRTLLRSHVSAITCVVTRPPVYDEFATMGTDGTIRVWDVVSGQQKFEFESSKDIPTTGSYHPLLHILTCGFQRGTVRVFNVDTTLTLYQLNHRSVPVVSVLYSPVADKLLVSAVDGHICVYNTLSNYQLLKTISGSPVAGESIYMAISSNGSLLATSGNSISSLTVYSMLDLKPVLKVGNGDLSSTTGTSITPIASLTTATDASSMMLFALQNNASPGTGSQQLRGRHSPNPMTDTSTNVTPAKYSGVNTLLSPASLATSNITNNYPHASIPLTLPSSFREQNVKGLVFCEDDVGFIAILILTEKRIICLSVLVLSIHSNIHPKSGSAIINENNEDTLRNNRLEVSWGEVSSRKLDIPNPLSIYRDPETGMIFIPFNIISSNKSRSSSASKNLVSTSTVTIDTRKASIATNISGQRVADLDDKNQFNFSPSLAVLIAKLKPTRLIDGTLSRTLVTSSTQAYRELPASVSGVACSSSFGRVVTIDISGGVSIWTINPNHIDTLSAGISHHPFQLSNSVKEMLSMMDAKHTSPLTKPLLSSKGSGDSGDVKRRDRARGEVSQNNRLGNNKKSGNDKIIPSKSPRNTGRSISTSTAATTPNNSNVLAATPTSIPSTSGENLYQHQQSQHQQSSVTSGLLRLSNELKNTISHLENWDILPSSDSINLDNKHNATTTRTMNNSSDSLQILLKGGLLSSSTMSTTSGRYLFGNQRAVSFVGLDGTRSEGAKNHVNNNLITPTGKIASVTIPTSSSVVCNNTTLKETKSTGSQFEEMLDNVNLGEVVEDEDDTDIVGDDEMNVYESYETDNKEFMNLQKMESTENNYYQFESSENIQVGSKERRRTNPNNKYNEINNSDESDDDNEDYEEEKEEHVEEVEQKRGDMEEDNDDNGSCDSSDDDDILRSPLMSQKIEEDKKYYELIRPKIAFLAIPTDDEDDDDEEEQREFVQDNFQRSTILQQQQQHQSISNRMVWTAAADNDTTSTSAINPGYHDHVEFLDSTATAILSEPTQTTYDNESNNNGIDHYETLSKGITDTAPATSGPVTEITILSQSLPVSPIIGHHSRVMVTTDGHSVFVKDFLINKTSVLPIHLSTTKIDNIIIERRIISLALSHSNLLIAAVIMSKPKEEEGMLRNSKLLESESKNNKIPLKYELMIWKRIQDPREVATLHHSSSQLWEVVRHNEGGSGSGSTLRLGDGTNKLYIDWHNDDSLVVLSPLGATGDSIISLLPASRLLAGNMPQGTDVASVLLEEDIVVIPSVIDSLLRSGEVLDMKVLYTKSTGMSTGGEVRLVILKNYSAVIVSALFGRSTKAMNLHKQEVDPSGSFLSLSVSSPICNEELDPEQWSQRLVLLDSLGKLRFISLTSTRIDSILTKFRKSSVTSNPLSVCLSPDSQWLLLNSIGLLRVFQVELLENNNKNNRNRMKNDYLNDYDSEEEEMVVDRESEDYETTSSSVWKEGIVAVTFHFLTKIPLSYTPKYLLFMPISLLSPPPLDSTVLSKSVTTSSSIDFLLSNEEGSISFVQANCQESLKLSQRYNSVIIDRMAIPMNDVTNAMLIQSNLPHSADIRCSLTLSTLASEHINSLTNYTQPSLTLLGNHNVLVLLNNKGKILFYHTHSGIRLPDLKSTGGASCTCVASTGNTLAVGLSTGNIALYDCQTLALQQLISFKLPSTANSKDTTSHYSHIKGGVTAVESMLFLTKGEMLLVLHVEGTVTLCDLRSSKTSSYSLPQSYIISQPKETSSNTTTNNNNRNNKPGKCTPATTTTTAISSKEIILVSTEDNPNMFGILYTSTAILELYKISFTTTNSFGLPSYSNIKGGHVKIGKIGSICLVNYEKQMLRITNICLINHFNDLRIFTTTQNTHNNNNNNKKKKSVDKNHQDNTLLIPDYSLNIAVINKKEDLFEGDNIHLETVTVLLRKIMDIGKITASIFKSNYYIFVTSEVIKFIDLKVLLDEKVNDDDNAEEEERKEAAGVIANKSDLENGDCIYTLNTFGKSKEVNWENSLLTMTFDDHSPNNNNRIVYILRCNTPTLLKIVF